MEDTCLYRKGYLEGLEERGDPQVGLGVDVRCAQLCIVG